MPLPCQPTWLRTAQKSRSDLQTFLFSASFVTMQSHGACRTAGKCFCTVPFPAKVPQPPGLQFKMSRRNVPCLQMEPGAGICQLRDCSERQSETPDPLQSCGSSSYFTSAVNSEKKMLNDAELSSSLSHSCLTCLGAFETPVSLPPRPPPLLCRALRAGNQSQHDPPSKSSPPSETSAARLSYHFIRCFYFWTFRPMTHPLQRLNSKLAARA